MEIWGIILAAGKSSRLAAQGMATPKQFLSYEGRPLFWHAAKTFSHIARIRGLIFVFPECIAIDVPGVGEITSGQAYLDFLDTTDHLGLPLLAVTGGARRQDSVRHALSHLPPTCDSVLIHDAARPFATAVLIQRIIRGLEQGKQAVIPGVAVTDTIKGVTAQEVVQCTHERSTLRAVQTPQGFTLGSLRAAHTSAQEQGWDVTDDAALMERMGIEVHVVAGEESNRKITTSDDLALLAPVREDRMHTMLPCTGFGYDVHRYGGNRPFILGGVPIQTDIQVAAHSDGDTLLHALIDAMLGCIGGGDIGTLFPDADPAFDNISSGVLLAEVRERCILAGFVMTHVDITIIAQVPRIAPHREAIAKNIAKLLQLSPHAVNVKSTTEERLGFTGEKKGLKVVAVVTGCNPQL